MNSYSPLSLASTVVIISQLLPSSLRSTINLSTLSSLVVFQVTRAEQLLRASTSKRSRSIGREIAWAQLQVYCERRLGLVDSFGRLDRPVGYVPPSTRHMPM